MTFKNGTIIITTLLIMTIFSLGVLGQEFPVTITDDLDQEVTLEQKPEKIISISPNMTEVLFVIGAGENVIGVTTFANYPKEALEVEKIGTITEPNIEKIITLEPDLVLASSVNKMETVKRLKELGIVVAGYEANNVNKAIENIKKIGLLTGNQDITDKLVTEMYIKIAEMRNLVDKLLEENNRPKVFFEIWNDPLFTAGSNTFIDDLIQIAGGENLGRLAEGQWPQYNLEKLLIEDPDVYISTPHSAEMQVSVESIKNRERFQSINAIKNNRIYIIDQDIVNRPSPRLVKGLALMIKAIYPELEEEVDSILNR
ncbi:MAG: cobalamin-binding protein [Halanaerobiales bacterium]|nr:cobalamin-binding protein [Halanaerobiales bacterium]